MCIDEAKRIALNAAWRHSSATFTKAAAILEVNGEPALRQLAELKAIMVLATIEQGMRVGN